MVRAIGGPIMMRVLRGVAWVVTVLWALFWVLGGTTALWDPGSTATNVFVMVFMWAFGIVPALPFWIWARRRHRREAAATAGEAVAGPVAPTATVRTATSATSTSRDAAAPAVDDLASLPASLRAEWRRLEGARDLVEGFAAEGWIEAAALREVDGHVRRLRTLLEADERTVRLGGTSSATLHRQLGELTALLVALADSAVEHQATLMSDDPVPVTLAEARDRLSTSAEAYRGLQQPG